MGRKPDGDTVKDTYFHIRTTKETMRMLDELCKLEGKSRTRFITDEIEKHYWAAKAAHKIW